MDNFDGENDGPGGDGVVVLALVVMSAVWLALGAAFGVWLS